MMEMGRPFVRVFWLAKRRMRSTHHGRRRQGRRPTDHAGICFEPLEPRLLLSGSWGAGGDAPSADVQAGAALTHDAGAWESRAFNRNQNGRDFESQVDVLAGASALNLSAEQTAANLVQTPSAYDPASEMMNQTPGRELVLINSNLAGTDQLITDLSASDRLNSVEVVLLDAERGGIAQVNAILSARANLAAVHVLTHGSEGQIQLGNEWLNSATLQENRHSVAGWGDALIETGDFLFYGCDIAADSLGESLLNTIADLTGADVAASNDATGHASKGGDWTLEYTTGVIEKKGAVQPGTLDNWSHLLAPPVASDDSYSVDNERVILVDGITVVRGHRWGQ